MLVELDREADRVDDAAAIVLGERQIGDRQLAGQRHDPLRLLEQQPGVGHAGGLELLDNLLVGDPGVFLDLVEVEQLLPRRSQILVGGKDRHQRAERQIALDDQIAADQEKQERGDVSDQIVEEFYKELAVIDLKPDVVDLAEPVRDLGQLVRRGVIGADFGASSDRANWPMRLTKSDEPADFSISRTIALPTTAASAKRQTSRTCSGVETPNPTATGKSLTDRTRFTRVSASRVISLRGPVTPARDTA